MESFCSKKLLKKPKNNAKKCKNGSNFVILINEADNFIRFIWKWKWKWRNVVEICTVECIQWLHFFFLSVHKNRNYCQLIMFINMTQFCGNLKLIRVTMQHHIIFKLKAETKSTCYQYNLLSKLNASYPSQYFCASFNTLLIKKPIMFIAQILNDQIIGLNK